LTITRDSTGDVASGPVDPGGNFNDVSNAATREGFVGQTSQTGATASYSLGGCAVTYNVTFTFG
ncbi:MAG: hypothetical protein QOG39_251, partial [Acidimicrobiaceae bacterium]